MMVIDLFINEKKKVTENLFGKKVNSSLLKGEIYSFKEDFRINFPIMRKNRKESKKFNKEVKASSELIIDSFFTDINSIITSVNYKFSISIKDYIIVETFKFCFFYNNKNIVFNVLRSDNNFNYIYLNNVISIKDLKHIILLNLFKIDSLKTFNKDILIYNIISVEDIDIIKILLI